MKILLTDYSSVFENSELPLVADVHFPYFQLIFHKYFIDRKYVGKKEIER